MTTNVQREVDGDPDYSGKRGGFRRIDTPNPKGECLHPEHNPPSHMYLEVGIYEYTCTSCGNKIILTIPKITM